MLRSLSYSEVSSALTCQAQWDFGYGGHLTNGQTLKSRQIAPILSSGRAWGTAVAAWHAFSRDESLLGVYDPAKARMAAHEALRGSYAHDIAEQRELGFLVTPLDQVQRELNLSEILDHYCSIASPFQNLHRLEEEIDVPLPSRTGKHASSRYRFQGFLDGVEIDDAGQAWVVEFKLRDNLTPLKQLQLSRQLRWYAWGLATRERHDRKFEFSWHGHPIVGVIVDERLNQAPKPPRIVQARRKNEGINGFAPSHAVDQLCRVEDYIALCQEFDVEPHDDTIAAMRARTWQKTHQIVFRQGELEEAGNELISAAKLIRDLDSGELWPVRNAQKRICGGCRFKDICADPTDDLYIDLNFVRTVPKRLRTDEDNKVAVGSQGEGDNGSVSRFDSGAPSPTNPFALATYDYPPVGV